MELPYFAMYFTTILGTWQTGSAACEPSNLWSIAILKIVNYAIKCNYLGHLLKQCLYFHMQR